MPESARIGPGPLSQQLLNVSNQIRAIADPARQTAGNTGSSLNWVLMPQQEVSFRLEQGRVWHENLTMRVGDLPLRTTGWVALNQHLSLTAAIPFQERWVGSNRWLAGLKGQTIAVPIGGTLQAPQLDTRGLTELNRQIVTGAAGGLLQQELQKQLERLLPQSSSGRQDK